MNIDIALALHKLVPDAAYSGATDQNTEEQYDELRWSDERPKPSFQDVSDLCATRDFVKWSRRLMCAPASRADMGLNIRADGLITRPEAVQLANGSFPDTIYDRISSAHGEDEAFRLEMLWAGSTRHLRLSEAVDAVSALGYDFEQSIDRTYGIETVEPETE